MLSALSYFNLIFAVVYFLAYLLNGSAWVISGLLLVVVFNWMVIRNIEQGLTGKWPAVQWLAAAATLLFGLYTGYGAVVLLVDTVEYQYYSMEALLLISSGFLFSFAVIFHLLASLLKFL